MTRRDFGAAFLWAAQELPDIGAVPPDLATPPMKTGDPSPGRRVRQTLSQYRGSAIHHALYLPADWAPERKFPVFVEYAGNGNYSNQYGDISTGRVEGSNLGYGITGGTGYIWLCLPYVNLRQGKNEIIWWGDADATAEYCRRAVDLVCARYGGDPDRLVLAGFSRGAIACNYIGLRDDRIAQLWRAFIPYSHYDGVHGWEYAGSDRYSALQRLHRLRGRPQFICHERSIEETRGYLRSTGVQAPFRFRAIDFRNHNDAWTLRDIPERREVRAWLAEVIG
ncbi:MAG: hypothetical protein FJW39_20170 [Acidobacteria bacterium]|nr:hypothetical protein [Acidobacteriota bacterium]